MGKVSVEEKVFRELSAELADDNHLDRPELDKVWTKTIQPNWQTGGYAGLDRFLKVAAEEKPNWVFSKDALAYFTSLPETYASLLASAQKIAERQKEADGGVLPDLDLSFIDVGVIHQCCDPYHLLEWNEWNDSAPISREMGLRQLIDQKFRQGGLAALVWTLKKVAAGKPEPGWEDLPPSMDPEVLQDIFERYVEPAEDVNRLLVVKIILNQAGRVAQQRMEVFRDPRTGEARDETVVSLERSDNVMTWDNDLRDLYKNRKSLQVISEPPGRLKKLPPELQRQVRQAIDRIDAAITQRKRASISIADQYLAEARRAERQAGVEKDPPRKDEKLGETEDMYREAYYIFRDLAWYSTTDRSSTSLRVAERRKALHAKIGSLQLERARIASHEHSWIIFNRLGNFLKWQAEIELNEGVAEAHYRRGVILEQNPRPAGETVGADVAEYQLAAAAPEGGEWNRKGREAVERLSSPPPNPPPPDSGLPLEEASPPAED